MTYEILQKDMYIKNAKRAWMVAFLFGVGFILSVIAIVLMTPLKKEVPYVVRVNEITGAVDVVQVMSVGKADYGEVVDKKSVADYIKFREGYDYFTVNKTYAATLLMSSPEVGGEFKQTYDLHQTLGKNARVDIDIISIALSDRGMAQGMFTGTAAVRYRKTTRNTATTGITVRNASQWVATIKYAYFNSSRMSEQERLVNPLAFQVLSWRSDPEQVLATPRLMENPATESQDATPLPAEMPLTPLEPHAPSDLPPGTTTYPAEIPQSRPDAIPMVPATPAPDTTAPLVSDQPQTVR